MSLYVSCLNTLLTPSQRGAVEARMTPDLVTGQQTETPAPVVSQRVDSPAQAPRHWRKSRILTSILGSDGIYPQLRMLSVFLTYYRLGRRG